MKFVAIIAALIWTEFASFKHSVSAQLRPGPSPPFYNGSFRALGEIILSRPSEDSAVKEVHFFEELYDSANLKAALRIHSDGETLTYFQDIETRQTFLHRSSDHNASCNLISTKADSDTFGPLPSEDGLPHFYLRDLLTSQLWNSTPEEAHYPARNMSCDVWVIDAEHDKKPLIVAMAVNAISWDSTTDAIQTPVSVNIRYANGEGEEIQINIYSFTALDTAIHDDLLQLPDGVFCGGYKKAISRPPLTDMKVFNYHAEMLSPDGSTYYNDVWMDLERNLYRIDYVPTDKVKSRKRTLIVSGNEDAFYRISSGSKSRCQVKQLPDLEFDVQMITDPLYIKHMTPETFFSGDDHDIKLTYKKQTVKRGIPCHVWETLRTDWPPDSDGISTLWEWCFVLVEGQESKRTGGSTYMVSLDMTVVQVSTDGEIPLGLKEGARFSYNFYDSFRNPPELIDLHGFDISPCYKGNDSADAFLEVKLSAQDYASLSTAINGYFSDNNVLFVTFVLLDRFPAGVSVGIQDTQATLEDMMNNLNNAVGEGRLGITYKGVNLTASSWSTGLPVLPKPQPPPPPVTTSAPVSISTNTPEVTTKTPKVTTPAEEVTTEAPPSTTTASASTAPFEIITYPVVTDDEHEGAETTTPTFDVITELPAALGTLPTRYAPGVVGGATVGLFVLGALIGASSTYALTRWHFPSASRPTTVFH
ncbi:hypothetical protein V5799_008150 [Amblyomma americanum]|uniref:LolA-like domain-containing protein n=1 Tax=Amblyomma americanum TaxID=6943 RepID=A0AAQ4FE36_AMBAM